MTSEFTTDDVYGSGWAEEGEEVDLEKTVALRVPGNFVLHPRWEELPPEVVALVLNSAIGIVTATPGLSDDGEKKRLEKKLIEAKTALTHSRMLQAEACERGRKEAAEQYDVTISILKESLTTTQLQYEETIKQMAGTIEKAFGSASHAQKKGAMGEALAETWVEKWFPECVLTKVSSTSHSMDILVEFPSAPGVKMFRLLLEIKNKSKLNKDDVEKFEADAKTNRKMADAALFVSLRTSVVPMRGEFQVALIGAMPVAYLASELAAGGRGIQLVASTLRQIAVVGLSAQLIDYTTILSKVLHDQKEMLVKLDKVSKNLTLATSELSAAMLPAQRVRGCLEALVPAGPLPINGKVKPKPAKWVEDAGDEKS